MMRLCGTPPSRFFKTTARHFSKFANLAQTKLAQTTTPNETQQIKSILEEKGVSFKRDKKVDEIFDALDALKGTPHLSFLKGPIFRIPSHTCLMEFMLERALLLQSNELIGTRGVSSRTIIGSKGIGKTTMLVSFSKILPVFFPSVIPVYVDLNNVKDHSGFKKGGLSGLIEDQVQRHIDIEVEDPNEPSMYNIIYSLNKAQKKLFLVVDELDQLYRQSPGEEEVRAINTLSYLGNQPSGLVHSIVCGSSSLLPLLITSSSSVDREEFKLMNAGLPSLNGTKFKNYRVESNSIKDLRVAAEMLRVDSSDSNLSLVRAVTFFTGTNARRIDSYLNDQSGKDLKDDLPHLQESSENTLKDPFRKEFWIKVNEGLIKKNKDLLQEIPNEASFQDFFGAIKRIEWEKRLQPLTSLDIEQIFKEIELKIKPRHDQTVTTVPFHFIDRGWFSTSGNDIQDSMVKQLYPTSMFHLLERYLHQKQLSLEYKFYKKVLSTSMEDLRAIANVASQFKPL